MVRRAVRRKQFTPELVKDPADVCEEFGLDLRRDKCEPPFGREYDMNIKPNVGLGHNGVSLSGTIVKLTLDVGFYPTLLNLSLSGTVTPQLCNSQTVQLTTRTFHIIHIFRISRIAVHFGAKA